MTSAATLYARYLCSRDALQPVGQARRATIGYLVYKQQPRRQQISLIKLRVDVEQLYFKYFHNCFFKYFTKQHITVSVVLF